MTMTPEQLLQNFKNQQQSLVEEIRKLDTELAQKKELYVKLQGAIEGLTILAPESEEEEEEEASETAETADTEVVTESLA
jgi:tetrahydromethanopterin S-methyltransferase subunit A